MIRSRLVNRIPRGQRFALANGLPLLPAQNAIQHLIAAGPNILSGKFVFGMDICRQDVSLIGEVDPLSVAQILERHKHVVFRIELQHCVSHLDRGLTKADARSQSSDAIALSDPSRRKKFWSQTGLLPQPSEAWCADRARPHALRGQWNCIRHSRQYRSNEFLPGATRASPQEECVRPSPC